MFIELTDHLRCPLDHPEQFLVLLPSRMDGRRVVSGELGCPVCGTVVTLADGVADWGGAPDSAGRSALTGPAVAAFLGLSGPGGYVVLAGGAASLASDLVPLLPGIRLVLVNPPADAADTEHASVLRAPRLPIKSSSMRGMVLGADLAGMEGWVDQAVSAVLPGLRVVVEGVPPPGRGVEVMARTEGCWVGKRGSIGVREPGSQGSPSA